MAAKTIRLIKDEIANREGFESGWFALIDAFPHSTMTVDKLDELENEAMQLYANQMCEEQRKHHAFKIMSECKSTIMGDSLYRDIMKLPLATDNL
jgi:hypothetical protein